MPVAFIEVSPLVILAEYASPPPMFVVPGLGQVHGAQVGWTSPDGVYMLANLVSFVPPAGQMITGNPSYVLNGTTLTETYATVPVPPAAVAGTKYSNAIAAGIILTWSSSTTLNGKYALDQTSMHKLNSVSTVLATNGSFPDGGSTYRWRKADGAPVDMNKTQFKSFTMALSKYIYDLDEASFAQAAGGSTPTWPSNQVTITG